MTAVSCLEKGLNEAILAMPALARARRMSGLGFDGSGTGAVDARTSDPWPLDVRNGSGLPRARRPTRRRR